MASHRIRNRKQHAAALERLRFLMANTKEGDPEADDEIYVLALTIQDYERRFIPPPCPDPIDMIEFRMDQMGLSPADLIPYIGSPTMVTRVLNRKSPLTLDMIRRLHDGLGISAEVLIRESVEAGKKVA